MKVAENGLSAIRIDLNALINRIKKVKEARVVVHKASFKNLRNLCDGTGSGIFSYEWRFITCRRCLKARKAGR